MWGTALFILRVFSIQQLIARSVGGAKKHWLEHRRRVDAGRVGESNVKCDRTISIADEIIRHITDVALDRSQASDFMEFFPTV